MTASSSSLACESLQSRPFNVVGTCRRNTGVLLILQAHKLKCNRSDFIK